MLLIGHDTVGEAHAHAKATVEHLAEKSEKVLLYVLIYKGTRNLDEQSVGLLIERLKHNGFEPGVVLLLGDVLCDERKRLLPTFLRIYLHISDAEFDARIVCSSISRAADVLKAVQN